LRFSIAEFWRQNSADFANRKLAIEKSIAHRVLLIDRGELRLNDFAAAQAGGADADAFSLAGNFGVDRPQVDVPAPLGHVVGVADAVSRLRLFAADITLLCHAYSNYDLFQILFGERYEALFYRTKRDSDNLLRSSGAIWLSS
jgi:hypothetical protein